MRNKLSAISGEEAISYKLLAFSRGRFGCLPASPRQASLAPRRSALAPCSAFSLIEMVVVVAIIGLLLAIAVPVSVALVKSNQSKLTTITLETVKNAIDTFQNRKPLRNVGGIFEALTNGKDNSYKGLFGALPPSPTASLSDNIPPGAGLQATVPDNPLTTAKFAGTGGIIERYTGRYYAFQGAAGNPPWVRITQPAAFDSSQKYPTIECLIFFLRNYSPEAKAILDKLGKALTNEDFDLVVTGFTPNDRKIDDLYEVRDAWKNAIQYNVQAVRVPGGRQLVWELRSAGPDGKFVDVNGDGISDPFAAVEAGDDVVVSGMLKVEDNN